MQGCTKGVVETSYNWFLVYEWSGVPVCRLKPRWTTYSCSIAIRIAGVISKEHRSPGSSPGTLGALTTRYQKGSQINSHAPPSGSNERSESLPSPLASHRQPRARMLSMHLCTFVERTHLHTLQGLYHSDISASRCLCQPWRLVFSEPCQPLLPPLLCNRY